MIERHVTFNVLQDKCEEFEDFFASEYRPAMASMPGYIKVELLREQEDMQKYQMIIRFQTVEEAAAWRNSELHIELSPKLKSLYTGSELKVYEVVA